MATAVNMTTLDVYRSINTPDFPTTEWVINSPNLDALVGTGSDADPQVPKRYWVISPAGSQTLREMTQLEKDAVDVSGTLLAAAKTKRKDRLQIAADSFIKGRYTDQQQQNLQNLAGTVSGAQKTLLDSYFRWYESVHAGLSTAFAAVDAASTIPAVEAVSMVFTTFIGTDPAVTVAAVLAAAPGAVIGSGNSVYDASVSTTTSITFQTKVELLNASIVAGKHRFIVSYGWNVDSTASDIEVKLQEKVGAGAYADLGELHKAEPSESAGTFGITGSDQRFYTSRIFERTLTTGTYSWRVQYRSETTVAASIWETLVRVEAVT